MRNGAVTPARDRFPVGLVSTIRKDQTHDVHAPDIPRLRRSRVSYSRRMLDARTIRLHHVSRLLCAAAQSGICRAARWDNCLTGWPVSGAATRYAVRPAGRERMDSRAGTDSGSHASPDTGRPAANERLHRAFARSATAII